MSDKPNIWTSWYRKNISSLTTPPIHYAIQHTSPNGAWHRIERGEIKLDANFFTEFNRDFQHQHLWETFHEQLKKKKPQTSSPSSTTSFARLPLPKDGGNFS
ncbi:predicted protein [Coccidioides posadasii str. Silveira]|uniref:Predicted protein n=1 Tax=Coccidioides posadasii (strain RMSCC 757 / Silveira) TaxID=443226 RepID=E9DEM6_COCPS|nr:predicted protein [Coccidioides posadasii str. Silveira]